jgi:hypothetical protein
VISSAFAPPDENMLLGADQLGRDMFSRIIYGARNSVGLALRPPCSPSRWAHRRASSPPPRAAGSTSSWAGSPT